MKTLRVSVSSQEIRDSLSVRDLIELYGKDVLLNSFTAREIIHYFDKDDLLDAIGEDAIRDYINPKVVA